MTSCLEAAAVVIKQYSLLSANFRLVKPSHSPDNFGPVSLMGLARRHMFMSTDKCGCRVKTVLCEHVEIFQLPIHENSWTPETNSNQANFPCQPLPSFAIIVNITTAIHLFGTDTHDVTGLSLLYFHLNRRRYLAQNWQRLSTFICLME